MDKTYLDLFEAIAHSVELTAEQALEYEIKQNNEDGQRAATIMREDFGKLHDKIKNGEVLSRADYAKLFVGAWTVSQGLEKRKQALEQSLKGYKIDTMPKLNRIIDETKTDEEAQKLAEEIFSNT